MIFLFLFEVQVKLWFVQVHLLLRIVALVYNVVHHFFYKQHLIEIHIVLVFIRYLTIFENLLQDHRANLS